MHTRNPGSSPDWVGNEDWVADVESGRREGWVGPSSKNKHKSVELYFVIS